MKQMNMHKQMEVMAAAGENGRIPWGSKAGASFNLLV